MVRRCNIVYLVANGSSRVHVGKALSRRPAMRDEGRRRISTGVLRGQTSRITRRSSGGQKLQRRSRPTWNVSGVPALLAPVLDVLFQSKMIPVVLACVLLPFAGFYRGPRGGVEALTCSPGEPRCLLTKWCTSISLFCCAHKLGTPWVAHGAGDGRSSAPRSNSQAADPQEQKLAARVSPHNARFAPLRRQHARSSTAARTSEAGASLRRFTYPESLLGHTSKYKLCFENIYAR